MKSEVKRSNNGHHRNTKDCNKILWTTIYANKLENLGKMNKSLESYSLPKLNQGESIYLNRQITTNKIDAII